MTHDPSCRCKCHITDFGPCDDCSAAMTHDPLCTFPDYPYNICWVCELIAKVRANEKDKWTHTCPDNNCCNGGPN